MGNRFVFFALFIFVFTVIVDLYTYLWLHNLIRNQDSTIRLIVTLTFWAITILFLAVFAYFFTLNYEIRNPARMSHVFLLVGIYLMLYLPKLVFITFRGLEDLIWLGSKMVQFIAQASTGQVLSTLRISLISKTGLLISIIPFLAILLGMIGKYNYHVTEQEIRSEQLPIELDGLKIIHLSDIHLGSMYNKQRKVQKAIDLINEADADLVLFTGDLVNNFSEEAIGWESLFASIESKYGKYSVLGNHDYGDYWSWKSVEAKEKNLNMLMDIQENMGFKLLRNGWDTLSVNGARIGIIGVENWGHPPFSQYGNLDLSTKNLPPVNYRILLSHNPSHWDAEVLKKTDIPLTLSGHTHAMQFGIRLNNFRWSPVKLMYDKFMGMYQQNGQALYVNTGLGFIGFPGRVGIRPEITLITLTCKKN